MKFDLDLNFGFDNDNSMRFVDLFIVSSDFV